MRELFVLLAHLVTTLFTLCRRGGLYVVVAESLAVKHQLQVMNRTRRRAPRLTPWDRLVFGLCAAWIPLKRLAKCAVVLKPSSFTRFHRTLVRCKYRWLYASGKRGRPGPKGPTKEVIAAVVEMKRRNPRLGSRKIAEQISHAFGIEIDKDVVRRILAKHYHPNSSGDGVSWLTAIGHAKDSLWSIDLFRCESILLQSYWVMVVIDVFTRRIIGFGVARGDVDGVADFIREVRAWSTMPIVVLSARVEEHDKVEALDAGWRGFVHRCAVPPEPAKSKVPWCGLVTW